MLKKVRPEHGPCKVRAKVTGVTSRLLGFMHRHTEGYSSQRLQERESDQSVKLRVKG